MTEPNDEPKDAGATVRVTVRGVGSFSRKGEAHPSGIPGASPWYFTDGAKTRHTMRCFLDALAASQADHRATANAMLRLAERIGELEDALAARRKEPAP